MIDNKTPPASFGGNQAIIIGGSVAGLLAARVLSDHFEQITLIEKDVFSTLPQHRKGVPQDLHAHALLMQGQKNIEQLFPGVFEQLLRNGATLSDMGADLRWFHYGNWKIRGRNGITGYSQSRLLLEHALRTRLLPIPNIRLFDNCSVNNYLTSPDKSSVTGVRISRAGQPEEQIQAQLVVDTTGRGTRTPQWLEELGYPRVEESAVKVDTVYATRLYQRKPDDLKDATSLMIWPTPPLSKRMGFLLPNEDGRWIATLSSGFKDYPPTDEAGFLEFARNLPMPELYNVIEKAEPLSPIYHYKIPSNLRRHYERMSRFPQGLVVMGDAACSFNPIYGQGMTISSIEAIELGRCLSQQPKGDTRGLSRKYQKKVAKIVSVPWLLATSEDFRYSQAEGKRPFGLGLLNRYTARIHRLCATDRDVLMKFEKVMTMQSSPAILFAPRIILKVVLMAKPEPAEKNLGQLSQETA